jgi:two-component system cell cycle sensor histidine kinase/response regulator CckA
MRTRRRGMRENKECTAVDQTSTISYRLPKRGRSGFLLEELKKSDNRDSYKGKVLVMDDEEVIRMLLSVMLLAFGYEAHLISNGAEAITSYCNAKESGDPFDVIIIDLNIPDGMGGKETIRKLLEIDPDVKAIVSSGFTDDPAMTNYREYGFRGVLQKPYTVSDLRRVLQAVICDSTEGVRAKAEN